MQGCNYENGISKMGNSIEIEDKQTTLEPIFNLSYKVFFFFFRILNIVQWANAQTGQRQREDVSRLFLPFLKSVELQLGG